MAKKFKLINSIIKLGRNTVLFESFTDPLVPGYIGPGESKLLPEGINGVIVYYTLTSTNYVNTMFIPKNFFTTWFEARQDNSSVFVRVFDGRLEVSGISTGYGRVRAYQVVY